MQSKMPLWFSTSEITECTSNPCASTGVCEDLTGFYLCHCEDGYEGVNCERGELQIHIQFDAFLLKKAQYGYAVKFHLKGDKALISSIFA